MAEGYAKHLENIKAIANRPTTDTAKKQELADYLSRNNLSLAELRNFKRYQDLPQMKERTGLEALEYGVSPVTRSISRGAASLLGAPSDIGNIILSQFGMGSDEPVMGSEWIRRQMTGKAQIPTAKTAETLPGRLIESAVEDMTMAAPFIGPMARAAGGARAVTGPLVARETVAAAGGGAGAQLGTEVAPDSPYAPLVGGLLGGLGVETGLYGGQRLLQSQTGPYKRAMSLMDPTVLRGQAEDQISQQLAEALERNPKLLENLKKSMEVSRRVPEARFTLGQATGDPGLIEQERSLKVGAEALQRRSDLNQAILNEVRTARGVGIAEDFTQPPQRRMEALEQTLANRETIASQNMWQAMDELRMGRSPEEAGQVARQIMRGGEKAWRDKASKLYAKVPQNVPVRFEGLRQAVNAMSDEITKFGDPSYMPNSAKSILRETLSPDEPDVKTFKELQQIRRFAVGELRAEDGLVNKNLSKIHYLENKFLPAIEETLDTVGNSRRNINAAEAYREANEHYRAGAKIFREGKTGTVLKTTQGDFRVADEDLFGKFIHPIGSLNAQRDLNELVGKYGNNPEMMKAGNDYLLSLLNKMSPQGELKLSTLKEFRKKYRHALGKFPDASKRVANYQVARQTVERFAKNNPMIIKSAQKNLAEMKIGDNIDATINSYLSSSDPVGKFRQAMRMMGGDPQAEAGLRAALFDNLERKITSKQLDPISEEYFVNPVAFRQMLAENEGVIKALYPKKGDYQRLKDLQESYMIAAKSEKPVRQGTDTKEKLTVVPETAMQLANRLYVSSVFGVSRRYVVGITALKALNKKFATMSADQIKEVMEQAHLNPDYAKTLLQRVTSPEAEKEILKKIGGQLSPVGTGAYLVPQVTGQE